MIGRKCYKEPVSKLYGCCVPPSVRLYSQNVFENANTCMYETFTSLLDTEMSEENGILPYGHIHPTKTKSWLLIGYFRNILVSVHRGRHGAKRERLQIGNLHGFMISLGGANICVFVLKEKNIFNKMKLRHWNLNIMIGILQTMFSILVPWH